jgi:tetratricopeptide (TPR) repeat protein
VRLERTLVQTGVITPAAYRAAYASAFKEHGFDVLAGDPAAVAARVSASPQKDDLLAALDDWAHWEPDAATSGRVFGIARRVAGKSWRDAVGVKNDPERVEALLASVPPAARTPTLLRVVAAAYQAAGRDGTAVLHDGLLHHPGDFWLLYDLALMHEERGDRAARAARPSAWLVVNDLGVVLQKLGDLPAAEACFREANRLHPTSHSYSNLGNVLREQGDLAGAITAQREAVRLDPKYANARNNLGTALRDNEQIDEAIAEFRAAIGLDPADAAPRYNLGLALLTARKDNKAAAEVFREILRLKLEMAEEERVRLYHNLGHACLRMDDADGAVEAFREITRIRPTDAEARYELADILCQTGNPRAAIPVYRKAIELNPKVAKYHSDLGVELRRAGDLAGAIACQEKAIELDPKYVEAHINLGTARLYRREFDKAEAAFRKALELDPKLVAGHINLGLALFNQGKFEAAARAGREAVRLDPKMTQGWVQLGAALFRANDYAGAVAAWREAAKLDPEDGQVWFNIGVALRKAEDWDAAADAARKAGRLDPDRYGRLSKQLLAEIEAGRKAAPSRERGPPPRAVK